MDIRIPPPALAQIKEEGARAFPHEICGFLLGRAENGGKRVTLLQPAVNARAENERYHRYQIDPRAFLAAEILARGQGLDIVGFYHSHPNAPARPSDYDRDHAWPWYSYVIVSVMNGQPQAVTSWVLQDDRRLFNEEIIRVEA